MRRLSPQQESGKYGRTGKAIKYENGSLKANGVGLSNEIYRSRWEIIDYQRRPRQPG